MFWKVFISFIGKRRNDYVRAIHFKKETYIVKIEKFVPAKEELKKWEQAFENQRLVD